MLTSDIPVSALRFPNFPELETETMSNFNLNFMGTNEEDKVMCQFLEPSPLAMCQLMSEHTT